MAKRSLRNFLGIVATIILVIVLVVLAVIFGFIIFPDYIQNNTLNEKREKPNIIFVLVDDLGHNDVTWNNMKNEVYMPTMDRMARSGNILHYNYMQPACSPSRGVIMTGRYAHHIGMQHNVIRPEDPQCAPRKEKFMSEKLKELGYATHMVGKWHLGYCSWNCTALYRGFDTSYGFYSGFIDYYDKTLFGGYDWRDGKEVEWDTNGIYATDLITERAVDLISNHNSTEPLFMYLAHGAPHIPIQAPQKYIDLVANAPGINVAEGERLIYLAMLAAIDKSMEEVEKALIANDMIDNTIIIFTSDNGGEAFTGASNFPLRGAKNAVYEGGTRVPAFVYSPGLMEKTGVVSEDMIHAADWYPTVMAMATGEVEKDIDGVNQYNMIMKNGKGMRNEMIYNLDILDRPVFGRGAIRVGDFKLILGFPGTYDGWEADGNLNETYFVDLLSDGTWTQKSTHVKTYKYDYDYAYMTNYSIHIQDVVQLYNIKLDPEERQNIAGIYPEMVSEMISKIYEQEENIYDIDLSKLGPHPEAHHRFWNNTWSPGWC